MIQQDKENFEFTGASVALITKTSSEHGEVTHNSAV